MNIFTLLLGIFTVILYIFLLMARKDIVIPVFRRRKQYPFYLFLALLILWIGFSSWQDLNGRIQTILAALVMVSFLLDKKGFTEDSLILFSLDNRGIPLKEIERVVLFQEESGLIKLNYFRRERRGPILTFDYSLTEFVVFLSTHLNEGSTLEILTKDDQDKDGK
ncbi:MULTISPECIES: hypothetical protein [Enterococcus]|uniref:DUF5673 domain-containing protein n=1 Tax=Enterococcus malodoratus ATCC 43197 TaxID=1158601 RepID=R2PEV8_9ENTE|nr:MULTISPECIES: hypothetical protein [Enterococcus]BBM18253.1 hypothetical protein G15_1917 [Enterococcus avium]EOH81758.1 hypothetical protein UAI_00366 [Enterococcus malodoratus ATCC 43197]EOT68840.1 hypothetical protein I585_00298 [Enterococcus malodoratus ATCC 43197]SET82580.1 hypothetical protein SAMN04487821_12417 [Enterococcus malodoratus]SPW86467.1 Uncharacterised protein [Enterococcus malodoratus]